MFTFQEISVSKPSVMSWSRSVGMMNKKVRLAGLVYLKASSDPATKPASAPVPYSSSTNEDIPTKPTTNALSLLGSYSSSDSEWYVDHQLFSAAGSYHILGTVNIFMFSICFSAMYASGTRQNLMKSMYTMWTLSIGWSNWHMKLTMHLDHVLSLKKMPSRHGAWFSTGKILHFFAFRLLSSEMIDTCN